MCGSVVRTGEEAAVQASEEELEAYAHGWVDYGDVDADPY